MALLRKNFKFVMVGLGLLIIAVVTQSQTITSMVNSSSMLPAVRDSQSRQQNLQYVMQQVETRLQQNAQDYEAQLLKGVINFQLGNTDQAVAELTTLTQKAPAFHLAHLFLADMLAAKVMPVTDIGTPGLFDENKQAEQLLALRDEAYSRVRANLEDAQNRQIPLQFLTLNAETRTALLVDKSKNRLYVFERTGADEPPRLQRDFYISTGKRTGNKVTQGDLRTPEGVYFITGWIPDGELPEKYGVGAFPTNYPNALDRHLGKTGDGIWLHGTDRVYYSRPPLDSEGCVVMSNLDLSTIRHLIVPGVTPIVIAEAVQWVDATTWRDTRKQLTMAIEQWRQDWESLDVNSYLGHYAQDFWSEDYNYEKWADYKRNVAAQKTFQKIELKNLSLFYYPHQASSGKDMVVARFRQDYKSNNFNGETTKHLYLAREQEHWKIVYEGK